MASAAFVTEFRSFVSFECETTSTEYLNLKHFDASGQRMAPLQEIPRLLNEKKLDEESPSVRKHESPMSSPGTSGESSGSPSSQPSDGTTDISPRMVYNPSSEESNGMENGSDHLKRMEDVLEKNGIFGQNPPCTYEVNGVDSDDDEFTYDLNDSRTTIPKCHFCGYAAETKDQYNVHIHGHFPFKCADCSYMARTKGRLENHMKNHREVPESYWQDLSPENGRGISGNGDVSPPLDDEPRGSKKDRVTKCKHCSFVGISKSELYTHLRQRLCFTGPLLECDFEKKNGARCDFCTQYKHHLEYHLRNHFGSKPFKCHQCKYTCVNQSMLNSHMKSHSNDYPYRCKTCTYATKYLHSLKMHLKKYDHEPDKVLNADGSVNNDLIIDVNGRRRGPKSKKAKASHSDAHHGALTSSASPPLTHPSLPATNYNPSTSLPSLHPSFVYNTPMFSNMASNGFFPPPFFDPAMAFRFSSPMNMDTTMRCHFPNCEYVADSSQSLNQHLSVHMMNNYQAPLGINPAMYPQRHNFGSDNKPSVHFQNEVEHIPRTQANNDSHYRSRDHHVARASGAFKYSGKVEMEMRGGVSPPMSNGASSYEGRHVEESRIYANEELCHKRKIQELKKISLNENLTKMKLMSSESSSMSPPSTEHPTACSSSSSNDSYAELDCTSPMDLTKNFPPKPKTFNGVDSKSESENKRQTAEPVSIQPQRAVKNRRKGKAFKIDHYMQYDDQSVEFCNDVEGQIPKNQPDVKMEAEDLSLSPPRMNGELQEFHSKPTERISTPKRTKSPPQTPFQVSTNHCSTPKVAAARNEHSRRSVGGVREVATRIYNGGLGSYCDSSVKNGTLVRLCMNDRPLMTSNGASRHAFSSPNGTERSDQKANKQESNDKHTCPHCEIGFVDFVMLALHMTCHTVGAPFVCNKCNEDCKDRVNFMYHMINKCKRS